VAVNLAMILHNEETPAILVDANLQFGDVAVFLNEQGRNSVADLAPRADELDPDFIEEVLLTHSLSGVKILPSPSRPEYAEHVTGEQFSKVLQYLRRLYSYVIVDTSSALDDVTLSAVDTCDLVILLTNQDIPSVKDARQFLEIADALKIILKRVLFVMNRFDKRIGITPEKIGESFKHEVSVVLPYDEKTVIPSINRGRPFILEDKSKPISRAFLSLAETVRQRLTEIAVLETQPEQEMVGKPAKRMIKR